MRIRRGAGGGVLPLLSAGASGAAVVIFCLLVVQLFVAAMKNDNNNQQLQFGEAEADGLKVSLRRESLENAPSCIHTFSQLELLNLVSTSLSSNI